MLKKPKIIRHSPIYPQTMVECSKALRCRSLNNFNKCMTPPPPPRQQTSCICVTFLAFGKALNQRLCLNA